LCCGLQWRRNARREAHLPVGILGPWSRFINLLSVVENRGGAHCAAAYDHKLRSPVMAMKKKSTKKRAKKATKKAAPARKRSVRKTAKKK
jgi:hypothetical protein